MKNMKMLEQMKLRKNFQLELNWHLKIAIRVDEVEEAWVSFYLESDRRLSYYSCYDDTNRKVFVLSIFSSELIFIIRYSRKYHRYQNYLSNRTFL